MKFSESFYCTTWREPREWP